MDTLPQLHLSLHLHLPQYFYLLHLFYTTLLILKFTLIIIITIITLLTIPMLAKELIFRVLHINLQPPILKLSNIHLLCPLVLQECILFIKEIGYRNKEQWKHKEITCFAINSSNSSSSNCTGMRSLVTLMSCSSDRCILRTIHSEHCISNS